MNLVLDTMCGGPERVSLADERTVREVRGLLRAPREVGDALESRLSSRLERLLDADLTAVRVHRGDVAHRLTACLGAPAVAHGDDLFFAPGGFAPGEPLGLWRLGHELAHSLQQRGARLTLGHPAERLRGPLEVEADAVARAVLAGRRVRVRPRPDCPEVLTIAPLLLWAAAAIVLGAIAAYTGRKRGNRPASDQAFYERHWGWAMIPFVGSVNQALYGRTALQRFIGGAMVVLDASLVGGLAVRGVVVGFRGGAQAFRMLLRGGGTAVEREAAETLVQAGTKVGEAAEIANELRAMSHARPLVVTEASEAAGAAAERLGGVVEKLGYESTSVAQMEKALSQAASRGPVLVASTETTKRVIYHSVTYVINNGRIWMMHGGPTQLFFRTGAERMAARAGVTEVLAREVSDKIFAQMARRMNTASLYQLDAHAAEAAVQFWERQISRGRLDLFLRAEGCGGSQALLLKAAGRRVAGAGGGTGLFAPLFPLFLDAGRSTLPGVHRIVNTALVRSGTAIQVGVHLGVFLAPHMVNAAAAYVNSLESGNEEERANLLPISALANPAPDKPVGAIHAMPVETVHMAMDLESVGSDAAAASPKPNSTLKLELAPGVQDWIRSGGPSDQTIPGPAATDPGASTKGSGSSTIPLIRVTF
jgi:hypothetical protein